MAEHTHSTPLDVTMRAKHRGKDFNVRLRAIKAGIGLVKSEQPLEVGGRLILHSSDPGNRRSIVQLFASVVKHYEKQQAFALRWEKLVSPSGTGALMDFLQKTLEIQVLPGSAMAAEAAEGEMVYYEFASEELHLPNQGRVARRNGLPQQATPPAGLGTSPQPGEKAATLTTRPLQGGAASEPPPEVRATAAAKEADQAARPFYKEDDEVVELFGMKVTKENWDRLENLEYSGTHHSNNGPSTATSHQTGPVRHRRETPRPAASPVPPEEDKAGENTVSRFFRKIADKLSDKE